MSIQSYSQLDAPDPLAPGDLATKHYVDSQIANAQSQSGVIVQDRMVTHAGWGATTSTTYVTWGAGNVPITKQYAGTNLRVMLGMSGYVSTAGSAMTWGISPTASTSDITQIGVAFYNVASSHQAFTFLMDFTGRPVGSYIVNAYVHSNASTVTISSDGNDVGYLRVTEVWP